MHLHIGQSVQNHCFSMPPTTQRKIFGLLRLQKAFICVLVTVESFHLPHLVWLTIPQTTVTLKQVCHPRTPRSFGGSNRKKSCLSQSLSLLRPANGLVVTIESFRESEKPCSTFGSSVKVSTFLRYSFVV